MTMSETISHAFRTVKREPALWVLGAIVSLLGGGFSTQFRFDSYGGGGGGNGDGGPWMGDGPSRLGTLGPGEILLAVLAIFLILFGIGLLIFLLRCVAEAGLIHGTERAATGEDVHWRDLWRAGWSAFARRLFGVKFLLGLPIFLLVMVAIGLIVASLALVGAGLRDMDVVASGVFLPALIGILFCALPLFFLAILVGLVLSVVDPLASRAVVLEGKGVTDSIRLAWRTMMAQKTMSFSYFIVAASINVAAGLVLSLVFGLFALLLGAPLFLMAQSGTVSLVVPILLGILALLIISIIMAIVQGPLVAYLATFWTLAWQNLQRAMPTRTVLAGS